MLKRLLAVAIVVCAAGFGLPVSVAQADPHGGDGGCDCGGGNWNGGGYYNGGYYPGYYGGWYPGKWLSGCVSGPFGYVQVCW